MSEKVMELLVNCLPAVIAGLACIITMFKVLGGINAWRGSINDSNLRQLSKDLKNVVKKNQQLIEQNEEYKAEVENLKQDFKKCLLEMNELANKLTQNENEEIEQTEEIEKEGD